MNISQKIAILNSFLINQSQLEQTQLQQSTLSLSVSSIKQGTKESNGISADDFDEASLPSLDVVGQLMEHHQRISNVVQKTSSDVHSVLKELRELQNRKNNVNKLLDSMTAIRQVKRLSFSFGDSLPQIYKNLQIYAQIRHKIFYCDKYVQKIQTQISEIQLKYKKTLQKQLQNSNSEQIAQIAKVLSLISQILSGQLLQQNLPARLSKFYKYLISLQFKKYENQLFNIPIIGPANTSSIYIFFEIAKDVMKSIVTLIKTYKANILKVGGIQSLHCVICTLFSFSMEGIILEILMRQKKYFQIQSISLKKIGKQGNRLKDYFNQFSAIQNQIQRLRMHLSQQLDNNYEKISIFNNQLTNYVNAAPFIELNNSATKYLQAYTRAQFDRLLKKSQFIVPLWQSESEFLQRIQQNWKKSDKDWIESTQGHSYLVEIFTIFKNSLQKSLQTLNILIISSMVSFLNNNLVQQDSFHAFNEIFDKIINRFPTNQSKYYTSFILITNYIFMMPNVLQIQIDSITIPEQLQKYEKRLGSQLNQLVVACEHKCREVITSFLNAVVESEWFNSELQQDYKKLLSKWKGFCLQISHLFLQKVSKKHSEILFWQQFEQPLLITKNQSLKKFTAHYLINLQKQVRSIVSHYEASNYSVIRNFDKTLKYIQIMLADDEQSVGKLLTSFKIQQKQQIDKINRLRLLRS